MGKTAPINLIVAMGGAALAACILILVASTGTARAQADGTTEQPPTLVKSWGTKGTGNGQFSGGGAYGIATDSSGNVYVVDQGNYHVQKFDSNGNFITKWGVAGVDDGEFNSPKDIATDSAGNVYVADERNDRVQKFDSNGNFITKWGSYGHGEGQFSNPGGIATDSSGNVYVSDVERVQKFDSNGNFVTEWGSGYGSADGQFYYPGGIATDSSDNVYVADSQNYRVQKFDSNGRFIAKWGEMGNGDGEFNYPTGIATDSSGNVYVTDYFNHRVQKFGSDGSFIVEWSVLDRHKNPDYPDDVAIDSYGHIYVANYVSVQKFVTAPYVLATDPTSGATGVSTAANITADFSEEMNKNTLSTSTVKLSVYNKKKRKYVPVTNTAVSCDPPCQTVTLDPYGTSSTLLGANKKYKVTITTGVKDKASNALTQNKIWTFTTGSS